MRLAPLQLRTVQNSKILLQEKHYHARQFVEIDNNYEMDSSSIWKYLKKQQNIDYSMRSLTRDNANYSTPGQIRSLWYEHFN